MDADVKRAWDLMEKIGFCMLATRDGDAIRSRPMAAYVRRSLGKIHFLTDSRRHKDDEVRAVSSVCLAFADPDAQKYVSVSGRAEVSLDRDMIRELWSTPARAWWDSPDDPHIRLLTVTPNDAEYWDGSGKLISYVRMATAAVSGAKIEAGESKKVVL